MTRLRAADIRTAEHRLELLLDAVTDYAIYMIDAAGLVASWNAGAQRIKGYSSAEILGQHFSRFFTEEDRKRGLPAEMLQAAAKGGRFESEGWRVRKDGSRFWASAILESVRDDAGKLIGFAKVTRDVTERRQAQEALFESERRFRLLVEGVTDYAICMLDSSGVITNWNAGAQHITGYAAAEIVGRHFSRFYPRQDRAAGLPARALDLAVRKGKYEAEGWRVRKDGSRFWASVLIDPIRSPAGELIGFAKITRDVTERQVAQEALRESERQFRLLVNGVTDYALYMLDPNGVITSWNAGAERIKGYGAEEIVGQHFSRLYTDADRSAGVPARALATAAQEGRYEAEGWRVRRDGSLLWASVVIDAVRDEQGALIGFVKITRDVSERMEAQKALQKANEQLAHAQKMEALGQLTGGVAHDFNNLLMIVSGHAQIIKKQLPDDARALRSTEAIMLAATRGENLTKQLLSFSRRQRLDPTAVDLRQRMDTLREMLSNSIPANVRLLTVVPEDAWPVEADVAELELALVNLVVNSRDAMPEGGAVTIAAENMRLARGDVDQQLEGEFVALTVADTGSGIPQDIVPRIFDPFFTTKRRDKGSGLGLSQVHGFVHQSGGTVTVASEIGSGTKITMYLPRARSEPAWVEASGSATCGRRGRENPGRGGQPGSRRSDRRSARAARLPHAGRRRRRGCPAAARPG